SNTVDKTPSVGSLNVKASPDGGISDSQDRWIVMLEKSNITAADTLYFDENVSVSSYNVSSSTPVASYLVTLNDSVNRRTQSNGGQVTFEHDILGIYTHKNNTLKSGTLQSTGNNNVTTLSNSYFSNSSWTYPSAGPQTNQRDLEGTFGSYGNGNWVWSADGNDHAAWSSNSRTLYMAAKNGNSSGTGDFIRVVTKWSVPGPTAKNDYAWVNEGGSVSAADGQTSNGATGGMTNANDPKTFSDFSGGMERFDFNNDGSKLYVNDYSSGDYKQYSLSTPYDVSTATADNSGDSLDGPTSYYNIIFNGTGSKAFILTYNSDYIREYNLSTAYDIRTASYNRSQYVGSYDTTPTDFEFNSDGSKLFLLGSADDQIIQLNLSTPYNITTSSNGGSFDIGDYLTNTSVWGMTLSPDGKKIFVADGNRNIHEFFLPVANDVTTASFLGYTSVSSSIGSIGGIAFNNDGTKFYASDRNSNKIVEYNTSVPFSVQSFMPGGNTGDVLHTTRYASKDTGTNLSVNGFRKGGVEGQGTFSHAGGDLVGGTLDGEYGTLTMRTTGAYTYVANNNISGLDAGEVVYDHFNYRAKDGGNNNDTAVLTFTIVGIDNNTLPTAANNTVTIAEDATHTFAASQFNFADSDGDSLSSVKITSLPATGTLTLNGSAVSQNQTITASQIANLVYTPVANGNGDSYTSFQFKVNDGTADSASAYTMTIDVTPSNDLPTAANNTVTIAEDTTHTFAASQFNFADIDGDSLSSVKITSLPATGTLTLNGSVVSQNQSV
ncbi:cadherin-like domain-containing protein, partial [Alphaproteobacteria bacterium]|nr:cadherin-like domain-containing protein [Alphaproteobacteria bacterium]